MSNPVIAYVGGFEFPAGNAAASRAIAVGKLFRDAGWHVAMVGTRKDPTLGLNDMVPVDVEGQSDVWVRGYPTGTKAWLDQITSCDAVLDHLFHQYGDDLAAVVFYNYPAIAQYRAKRRLTRRGVAAVADVTEWYEDGPWTNPRAVIKNLDTRLRMHWVNRRMDALIPTSPFLSKFYQDYSSPQVQLPTLLTRNSDFDLKAAPVTNTPCRLFFAGSGFDPDTYAGRPDQLKDRLDWVLEDLDAAQTQGAAFQFNIFGVTEDAYLTICPDHKDLLSRLGDRVQFHGRQPRDQVLQTLWQSDFAIFLRKRMRSTDAGFPTKLSEPMTYGIPVLTNPLENVVDYVEDGRTGIFLDIKNRMAGQSALVAALALPENRRAEMKRACIAANPFAPEKFEDKIQRFLVQLKANTQQK